MEVASCDADRQPLQCWRSTAGDLSLHKCIQGDTALSLNCISLQHHKVLNLQSVRPKDEHFSVKFAPDIDLLLIQNVRLKGVCFNPNLLLQFRCLSHVVFFYLKQNRNSFPSYMTAFPQVTSLVAPA